MVGAGVRAVIFVVAKNQDGIVVLFTLIQNHLFTTQHTMLLAFVAFVAIDCHLDKENYEQKSKNFKNINSRFPLANVIC